MGSQGTSLKLKLKPNLKVNSRSNSTDINPSIQQPSNLPSNPMPRLRPNLKHRKPSRRWTLARPTHGMERMFTPTRAHASGPTITLAEGTILLAWFTSLGQTGMS